MNNDNVIKFQKALDQQEEENVCPHCQTKLSHIEEFMHHLIDGKSTINAEDLFEHLDIFYDIAFEEGKTEALEDVIGYASFRAYGEDEED